MNWTHEMVAAFIVVAGLAVRMPRGIVLGAALFILVAGWRRGGQV